MLMANVWAQTCPSASSGTTTVSTSCSTGINWTGGDLNIGSSTSGPVTVSGRTNPIFTSGTLGTLTNSINGNIDSLSASVYSVANYATITSLVNFGTINGEGRDTLRNLGTITNFTNYGSINNSGGWSDVWNSNSNVSVIGTLNNAQGGNGLTNTTTTLTYFNILPTNYNIIVISKDHYGQIGGHNGGFGMGYLSGATTFGIYGGGVSGVAASVLTKGIYTSVLSGFAPNNLNNISGNYNGFTWSLSETDTLNGIWDLIVTGASTADTQQSLVNTSQVLQGTFTLQNSVLANSFSYDCNVFGANNVCVSAGGRNTQVQAANGLNNTSALLIAAYRPHPNYRIGAYADQNLSVSNPGGTVNLGNNTPLIGLFGAWNQRLDGTGTEVKVSAAYGQKNATVTRAVVGTSEAGTGSSQLNSQGAQITAKYGFGIMDNMIVTPYAGVRYTQNNMSGYTEATSSSVTAPLTYSALNTNATTALAGIGASYRVIPTVTTFASAGVETDTNTSNGTYSATGITGLTPINFNSNPVKTRTTAILGAFYDIEKNQRLGITGIYRQEAYQAISTTTVMATYMMGL
jgi:hypothetical protein